MPTEIGTSLRSAGVRMRREHEDRPGRHAISIGDEPSHAGAGIADAAPHAGALDHVGFVLRVGTILRALQIVETLPARLRAAERFPIELDIKALGGEVTLLHGDEIVKAHALGRDLHAMQLARHDFSSAEIFLLVIASQRVRPEVAGPMTKLRKQSRKISGENWIASSLRS